MGDADLSGLEIRQRGGKAMNCGKTKVMLALWVGLATTVALLLLLSTFRARAATLTVDSTANGGPGVVAGHKSPAVATLATSARSTALRLSATASSVCVSTDFTYPLTIPLTISDAFGPRLLKPEGYSRYDFHRGIDLPADEGIPVHAVTTGTVRAFRDDWVSGIGSGNFVHLIHDREDVSCETRYNHLSAVHSAITNGVEVTPGQIIGWVGQTGAYYNHLHFEVRQGLTVTQRAAIHPLSTHFLPWTNAVTPAVTLRSVYTDATGLTALVEVTSPYTEPDVTAGSVDVSGPVIDSRSIDYVDLNANTPVVADLDNPLVNNVCIIPADLNVANDYRVTMAFRQLRHGRTATVTAWAADVAGWSSTDSASLTGGLAVTPPEQVAEGGPGQTVTFVYTLTNHTGASDTFTLTHLSAQGWPAVVTSVASTLGEGQSRTIVVSVTLNTATYGPPDCGLLVAASQSDPQQVVAGFYRIYRDTYVSAATGKDRPGCGTRSDPCASISYGISQTDAGGAIHVEQGTYPENLVLTRTIDLLGGYATGWITRSPAVYSTTVDGGGIDAALVISGEYGPLVEGFIFTNGHRYDGAGGGVRLVGGAAPTLRTNWILSNTAEKSGGGIYVGPYGTLPPTIIRNTIADNRSGSYGGGIYVKDRPALIQGNIIRDNRATANDGGGIYLTGGTTAQVLSNWILGNGAADDGGGVLVRNSDVYLANNVVADNRAHSAGGGLYIVGSSPRLLHTTIARNRGGDGSGVYIAGTDSTVALTNTILVSHTVGITVAAGNTATLTATLWGTGTWANDTDWDGDGTIITGTVNLLGAPTFVDPDAGNYHILSNSAAIDAGVDAGVPTDIDGNPRPRDGDCDSIAAVDIGAVEYYGCVYLPIVLKDFSPTGFGYDVQGCLAPITTTDDLVEIYVEGDDIVMHHYDVTYNCCAVIVVDFVDERLLLKLIERETYPGALPPCFCLCPYDVNVRISNLLPGDYRVEVWNEDQSHCYGWAEVKI
jgi:predicted outer membrane repeat protein